MELNRRTMIAGAAAAGLAATTLGSTTAEASTGGRTPSKKLFGKLADGTKVHIWSLANGGTRSRSSPGAVSSSPWRSPTATAATRTSPSVSTTSRTTSPRPRTSAR